MFGLLVWSRDKAGHSIFQTLKEPTVTGLPEDDTAQQPKQQDQDSGKGGKGQTDKEGPRDEPGHQREGGYDEA